MQKLSWLQRPSTRAKPSWLSHHLKNKLWWIVLSGRDENKRYLNSQSSFAIPRTCHWIWYGKATHIPFNALERSFHRTSAIWCALLAPRGTRRTQAPTALADPLLRCSSLRTKGDCLSWSGVQMRWMVFRWWGSPWSPCLAFSRSPELPLIFWNFQVWATISISNMNRN